jgi:hypothetical protein
MHPLLRITAMKLIGLPLRKPSFNEFTAAVIMAGGLWTLAVGLAVALHLEMGKADAGALLVVMLWGCTSTRVGVRIGMGGRHLVVHLLVSALLLGLYQSAWSIAAP